jgi:hypothetical protein
LVEALVWKQMSEESSGGMTSVISKEILKKKYGISEEDAQEIFGKISNLISEKLNVCDFSQITEHLGDEVERHYVKNNRRHRYQKEEEKDLA